MALFGLLSDNGPLSSPDAQIALAAGLLSGTGNIGANLSKGLLAAQSAAQVERANRQNDLQQLVGTYNLLKQQEGLRLLQAKRAGVPYQPNPMLNQIEGRLGQLIGNPNLSSQGPTGSALPAQPPAPHTNVGTTSPLPISQGQSNFTPSNSVMANPGFNPPSMPAQAPQQPLQQPQQADPFGNPAFGIEPEEFAVSDPSLKSYTEALIKARTAAMSRGVSFNPETGLPIAGFVDNVPVRFDAQGRPTVIQSGIPQAIADRAGMVTGAQEAAKAPYVMRDVKQASGAVLPMSLPELMDQATRRSGAPNPLAPQIPQAVIDANRSGQPFNATQAPGGPVVFGQPPVAKVTVTQPSKQADFFSDIPKMPQPQGIGQTTQSETIQKEFGNAYAETAKSLAADANSANQRMAYNAAALKALPNSVTGPGAQNLAQVKNFLVERFGIPESLFSEGPSATQELNKALINAATQKAKSIYGARLAQQEVMMQVNQASPALGMTKAAIKTLIDMDNQLSQYSIQKANDFGDYFARGGNPLLFDGWYARKKPLSAEIDATPQTASVPAASGVRRYNPATGKIE